MLARLETALGNEGGAADPPPPSASVYSYRATSEEEAEIRQLAPPAALGTPPPPRGRIEFIHAAESGPFRIPGDPFSAWTNGMAVEPGSAMTLAERYAASDPAANSRVPPLTWDAAPENRTKPGGASWRRRIPDF